MTRLPFRPYRAALGLLGALMLLWPTGCFRSPEVEKIKCIDNASCPTGYTCIVTAGQGKCSKGPGSRDATVGVDGESLPVGDGGNTADRLTTRDAEDGISIDTTAKDTQGSDLGDGALDIPVDTPVDVANVDLANDLPVDKPIASVDASDSSGCSPGTKQCNGAQSQLCDLSGTWQNNGAICAAGCNGGVCLDCVGGSKQCDGLQPTICNSGAWEKNGAACQFVCSMGACTGTCLPGSKRCNNLQPQVCDTTGSWQDSGAACDSLCSSATGACTGSCKPGTKQCSLQQPQTCDASGTWQSAGTACQYVCDNSTGACTGTCKPGDKQCTGQQPQICNAAGAWESNGATCSTNACVGGTCTGVCLPNSVTCSDTQPQVCDATGTWVAKGSACAYVCASGACTGTCKPGSKQCNVAQPQVCDNGGNWQNSGAVCPYVCSAGACTGTCVPGERQCGSTTQPQTCDNAGTWKNTTSTCAGSCETCSGGQCIVVTGNPPSGKTCSGTGICAGYCDGSKTTCAYPTSSTLCGTASCANGNVNNTACNGAGSCSTPVTTSCNGFPCSGSGCAAVCTNQSSTGCLPGYKCVGGNTCVTATLPCGTGTCPWGSKDCCATVPGTTGGTNADANYACIDINSDYTTCKNSSGVYGSKIKCTTKAECPSGQVCCDKGYSYFYPGMWDTSCMPLSDCSSSGGFAFQTCDPNLSPSECATGTCKLSPTGIPGLYTCQ